jgi:hypothetical protein
LSVTATDVAGNAVTRSVNYRVVHSFIGFTAPIDNLPVTNVVHAGRTVPVKWSLQDANGQYITSLSTVVSLSSSPVACDASAPSEVVDVSTAAGGAGLRYDESSNQFVFNWATARNWKGCRLLVVAFDDGTAQAARFQFR